MNVKFYFICPLFFHNSKFRPQCYLFIDMRAKLNLTLKFHQRNHPLRGTFQKSFKKLVLLKNFTVANKDLYFEIQREKTHQHSVIKSQTGSQILQSQNFSKFTEFIKISFRKILLRIWFNFLNISFNLQLVREYLKNHKFHGLI